MTKEQQLRQEDINLTNAMDLEAKNRISISIPGDCPLENIEVERYINYLNNRGYGHSIVDQERRVRAGIAIAHEIHRNERNEYEKLKQDNAILLSTMKEIAVNYPETNNSYQDTELVKYLIARAKETVYKITGSYPNI